MMINQTINFMGTIQLKNANNVDVDVACLTATLYTANQNFNFNIAVSNNNLFSSKDATNSKDETALQQYGQFKTIVEAKAKELGYILFS